MYDAVYDNLCQLLRRTPVVRQHGEHSELKAITPSFTVAAHKVGWGKRVLAVLPGTGERHPSTEHFS